MPVNPTDSSSEAFMQPMASSHQQFNTQSYAFTPAPSPYLGQQQFYDSAGLPLMYSPVPATSNVTATPGMYNIATPTSQPRRVQSSNLNAGEAVYSQQPPPQQQQTVPLPHVGSVPSNFPPISQPLESTPNETEAIGSRSKPQCWDHGCNGRQFSTFSNLLRHQREKSGTATKARCPHCNTEFTRTTARNGHMSGGKCKGLSEHNSDSQEVADDVP